MATFQWTAKPRDYQQEKTFPGRSFLTDASRSHPLHSKFATQSESSILKPILTKKAQSSSLYSDPLSCALEGSDPLSQFASREDIALDVSVSQLKVEEKDDVSQEWLKHRTSILNRFTTTENLSITSSFLQGGEKLVVKQQINDKFKHRLQQLDEFEELVSEHKGLSRDDYVFRITQISQELCHAWALDQRVKALKIVIQCSKLLLETHPFAFYPSKFALVTDILDNFGRMVFERIAEKGEIKLVDHKLPKHFKPEYVSETAKETCRNWMYKIASIRELLPRLYVEMAVLKSYSFLNNTEFSETLIRLSKAIRGVGDPLVAAYARCYLCRVGRETFIRDQSFVLENVNDLLLSYHQLYSANLQTELTIFRTDPATYLALYTPALDWVFATLVRSGQLNVLDSIWRQCFQMNEPGLLWLSILNQFPPDFIQPRCLELCLLITTTPSTGIPVVQLMTLVGQILGRLVDIAPASLEDDRSIKMLRTVWPFLVRMENPDAFLQCIDAWIPYLIRHWKPKEIHRIIKEVVDHLKPKAELHQVAQLNSIVQSFVLANRLDYHSLFSSDAITELLDVFPDSQSRAEAAKILLQQFLLDYPSQLTDSSLVDHLLHLASILHNTLNATSVEDEKRQIGELAIGLIERVDFGRDFQQMLAFYGDARAVFTNLDTVLACLVQMVNRLSSRTRQMVLGEHTERTGQFVRACGAFAFITIPGITCPLVRFDLYLLSGQIALANGCLGQADACLEAAINLIPELAPSDGETSWVAGSLSNLLSTLLVQPDTPGQSRLHHLRRLLRHVRSLATALSLPKLRSAVYLQALRFLSASIQPVYLYHIPNVESNDQLYLGDKEYRNELTEHCSQLLSELLTDIQQSGKDHHYRQQAALCLDLFSVLISSADLVAEPSLIQLAVQVYQLSLKHKQFDVNHAAKLLETVRFRSHSSSKENDPFRQLASILC